MAYLIAPSESEAIMYSANGITSSLPEKYGSDFLIASPRGLCGVQRKKFPADFFASIQDGRLTRELAQMQYLDFRILAVEEFPNWTSDGNLMEEYYTRWNKQSVRNLLRSVSVQHNVMVEWTEDIFDTLTMIDELEIYMNKTVHRSLLSRPKTIDKDDWGKHNNRDFARFFLQGLVGVGSIGAEAIFDTFNRIPMRWDITIEELMLVPGIGKKKAEVLFKVFERDNG